MERLLYPYPHIPNKGCDEPKGKGFIDRMGITAECAKFCGSRAIVGLVGTMPSRLRGSKIFSWVRNFSSWVFQGSEIFSSGYFVGI